MKWWRRIARILANVAAYFAFVVATLIALLLFWLSLQLDPPRELELIAVMVITLGAINAAAFITAMIHRAITPAETGDSSGRVFRESIKRYAWVAAPIASGYGIAQVITQVAEIIAQTPP